MTHPTPLHKLFSQANEELGTMVTKARGLLRLSNRLRRRLGEPLASHCGIANIKAGELILYASSSAWAARLRFAAPQIREALASELGPDAGAMRVKIRVIPPAQPEESLSAPPPKVSQRSAETLEAAAQSVEDAELGAALRRLARRADAGGEKS